MNDDSWTLIQQLFFQAVDLTGTKRARFIDGLNSHPPAVRDEVMRLLQQDDSQQQRQQTLASSINSLTQDLSHPDLAQYHQFEFVAQGGMGMVFKAVDKRLSRAVAIKVLHAHLSGQQKFKQRFLREARAAARISHDNINTIYDVGESADGQVYIASAFCEGHSLSELIHRRQLSPQQIISTMQQLASALQAAHELGIVHRDLKPENIIIDDSQRLKLVDFGIAKIRDEHQTSTGEIIGTPAYMSPEQFRGEAIDPLTDIWAAGVILCEMLEGKTPYGDRSAAEIIYTMLHEPLTFSDARQPSCEPLYAIARQCLNIDKSQRPADAAQLQQMISLADSALVDSPRYQQALDYAHAAQADTTDAQLSIATFRNVLVLTLLCGSDEFSDHQVEIASSLVRKHRGILLDRDATAPTALTAYFGFPITDDMVLRNGLACALAWVAAASPAQPHRAVADYQTIEDSERVTGADQAPIRPLDSDRLSHLSTLQQAGLWITEAVRSVLPEALVKAGDTSSREQQLGLCPVEQRTDITRHPFAVRLSPFTGRDSQLAVLQESWEQALEGDLQRVLISGEAGIGKSRLIYEFKQRVLGHANIHHLELACSPYEQSSTYYPILSYLNQQLQRADDQAIDRAQVNAYLSRVTQPEAQDELLLGQLMGVELQSDEAASLPSGDLLNRRYQSLLMRLLTARPADHTTLLIIEDLHWVDQASSQIVEQLLQPSSTPRTMILLSCRPEYKPLWLSNTVTSNLYLSKLRKTQSVNLLRRLISETGQTTSDQHVGDEVLASLADRTGGNPLFIEELAKSVGRIDDDDVPMSIQATLTARLDRLGAARELAQVAAVIGRNFRRSLLKHCTPASEMEFRQHFNTLVMAEIFYPTADPDQWYFKHALIRDAAYQSLQVASRQRLHESIATTIETTDTDTVERQPSLLAVHWERAGNPARAVHYWQLSAERNLRLSSISECLEQCQHALELTDRIEDPHVRDASALALFMTMGPAYMHRYGYADERVRDAYAQALQLHERVADTGALIPALFGQWTYYCVKAQHAAACQISQRMISISEQEQNREFLCESHMLQGINDYYRGDFTSARTHFHHAMDCYDRDASTLHILRYGQDPGVVIDNYRAWNELLLGNVNVATQHCQQAVAYARELHHPFTLVYALSFATWFFIQVKQYAEAQELVSESIRICEEQEINVFLGLSLALQALLYFAQGRTDIGASTMQRANEVYLATGAALFVPSFMAAQAEVQVNAGRINEAEEQVDQALMIVAQTGENWCLSLLQALKTMILDARGDEAGAAEFMQHLLDTLNAQHAEGIRVMLQQKGLPLS